MNFDIDNNIVTIKQKLKDSIINEYYSYLKTKIVKNVKDCNLLYTQVCYLIKLFLLYEFEQNINIDYDLNEIFIRFCFKLIKNGNKKYILSEKEEKDNLKKRLVNFYNDFNIKNTSFCCNDDLDSISHITNALSRDITTNIKNNITINFYKYLKEYIKINLKIKFEKDNFEITSTEINSVFNDIVYNTFLSNDIFHTWIILNKPFIIPDFKDDIIQINSIQDNSFKCNKILKPFIIKYIKNDELLNQICKINNFKTTKNMYDSIYNDIENNTLESNLIFHDWIKDNIVLIINKFNSINYIDMDTKLNSTPFIFIQHMLFMNKSLEFNKSEKHYQIIPLRTNMTPKFIPINTHALVDILDSKYLDNIKNYYHNNTSNGISVWNKFFLFTSDFIKNTVKKGFIFSGLIQTNGHEINFHFYSKKYTDSKNTFHLNGKQEIKNKKELMLNLLDDEKDEFEKNYKLQKEERTLIKKELEKEKNKIKKEIDKKGTKEKLKNVENEIILLNNKYDKDCEELKNNYSNNLKDITNKNDLNNETEKYESSMAYLKHCFNRDKETIINDYKNNIDEKYKNLIIEDDKIDKRINELKIILKSKKKELKKNKSKRFKNNEYIKFYNDNAIIKKNNKIVEDERNKLIMILNKIRIKNNLLSFECDDKNLTKNHIKKIKENLIKLLNKLKNKDSCKNIFLELPEINDIILKETLSFKEIFDKIIELTIIEIKKIEKSEINRIDIFNDIKNNNEEFNNKYNKVLDEIKILSKDLLIELENKKNNNNVLKQLFKTKDNEYMKIDTMSKKYLEVLDKLNWCVVDPGINTLFYMLSKDSKKHFGYTKKLHNNRVSFYKISKRLIKIKKEKIINIEKELSNDDIRLKTSNNYEIFKTYYNKKMLIHKELETLYNDERLQKLKWNLFINQKRAESMLINDIKKKFGNDVVLILGDWSMNKSVIRGISPTPNKKYTRILENNFLTLKINEFRTSIINNKYEKKCESYLKKYNSKYERIKKVHSLEKLKNIDEDKYIKITKDKKIHKILVCKANEKLNEYVDRDKNSTKNMNNIVFSYINTNYRPKTFVMGTKICKLSSMVL